MKNIIVISVLSVAVIAGLILSGCAKPAAGPSEEEPTMAPPAEEEPPIVPPAEEELPDLEINVHSHAPAESLSYKILTVEATNYLVEATNGRIKPTFYPACTLLSFTDAYRGLQEGVADFAYIHLEPCPGAQPLGDLFALPGLFTDNEPTSNVVLNLLYDKYPCFYEQFSPKVKSLATCVCLRAQLHSTTPIRTLDDFKGKVIGCQNEVVANALAKLGASTSVTPSTEWYTSGERGVIDGVVCAWGGFDAYTLHEVYKYHTIVNLSPYTAQYMMNRDTWNELTQDEQAKIELLRPWFCQVMVRGTVESLIKGLKNDVLPPDKGHEIIQLPEEEMNLMLEKFRPMWDEWAEDMEGKGWPGKAILEDAQEYLKWYGPLYG